jgi:hypothetical protein
MEYYRRVKIPEEVIERAAPGMDGDYNADYVVEPEHVRAGV